VSSLISNLKCKWSTCTSKRAHKALQQNAISDISFYQNAAAEFLIWENSLAADIVDCFHLNDYQQDAVLGESSRRWQHGCCQSALQQSTENHQYGMQVLTKDRWLPLSQHGLELERILCKRLYQLWHIRMLVINGLSICYKNNKKITKQKGHV
jgi:hypothetical protein